MSSPYYTTSRRKVVDFLVGMFGIPTAIIALLVNVSPAQRAGSLWLGGALWIGSVLLCFAFGRRFMGFGALCAVLVPLVAVGACFAVFAR